MAAPDFGPCAKTTVTCTLVLADGRHVASLNLCSKPQRTCPRLPGEGYEKCASICETKGHAEIQALDTCAFFGFSVVGAHAYIQGHTYACQSCQEALFAAGIVALTIGAPPAIKTASNSARKGPAAANSIIYVNGFGFAGEVLDRDSTDDIYARAVALVVGDRKPSTSYIQRRLQVGYSLASSLMDRMEREGIVGPRARSGFREVLRDRQPSTPESGMRWVG